MGTQRKSNVRTQQEDSHLKIKERASGETSSADTLNLAFKTVRK
jgi:hypothetical protein